MKKPIEEILESIERNWNKRQGIIWRIRNKLVYNFMRAIYVRGARKIIPDPSIDKNHEPFSFYRKPNMQLGLPGEEYATRVDHDGQLDTAHGKNGGGKFIFFTGNPIELVQQRIWTLTHGYLPEINYKIERDNVRYNFRAFQFWIEEELIKIPINFVQVDIENLSSEIQDLSLYCGMLFSQYKNKMIMIKRSKFSSKWNYSLNEEGEAFRDKKLLYLSGKDQKPSTLYSKLIKEKSSNQYKLIPYEGEFKGKKLKIRKSTITLIQEYKQVIKPKENKTLVFKISHYPIDLLHANIIDLLHDAEIGEYRKKFIQYWENILTPCTSITVPEDKVTNTSKASLVYNFMCQNYHTDGRIEQHVNRFQYNKFWIRDSSFYSKMYCMFNRPDIAKRLLLHFLTKQDKNGNFCSQRGQYDGWGQTLWAFGEYIKHSNDKEFAETIYKPMIRAIDWLQKTLKKDKWGLMPPRFAADNEMISGRYTGHNFWAWGGLNNAIYIADFLDKIDDKAQIERLRQKLLNSFLPILNIITEHHNNRIPPGLDTDIGEDWSNLLMIYPQKLLELDDPRIITTLQDYRVNKMPEGIAMWMVFLHHYVTERIAQQHLILDDQELVLRDLYSMLSHTGSCHEGFEHNIKPWGDRDYIIPIRFAFIKLDYYNFPPHGWFAVTYNLLLRNMLIREEDNNLHLLSAISPEWINGPLHVKDANTYFGLCNLDLVEKDGRLSLDFKSTFKNQKPSKIIIHIPYFIDKASLILESETDLKLNENKTSFTLNPKEEFSITIKWKVNQQIDLSYLSYEKAIDWLKAEYKKRFIAQK